MIAVGTVLDKYELLDRVGQGGMAAVYRGLDRSLKRTVAVKILHKHLADDREARERFEREAQAVAKLRHENILEIFDYAARPDSEAYIVTEFIDGQTLKQFITARPIGLPEVGAMLAYQVCRALAHAHAAMILHRDVKPENIMIRNDGVVKLMDFGISHMVDLERLTVTGQLLGSPAYMAPEHVEGKPIDFRTDVFAAGIVLYQLAVGKLPFEGRNPHEVLKRIAECKFVDPRAANPRIGNRLGKIILRAMAVDPADRFAAIADMARAIEAYLDESGLPADKIASELARFFQSPAPYEQALRERLIDHLGRRGKDLLERDEQSAALDAFDRVLALDPQNPRVLAILHKLGSRRRLRTAVAVGAAAVAIGAGSVALHHRFEPPFAEMPQEPDTADERELDPEPDQRIQLIAVPPLLASESSSPSPVPVPVNRDAGALAPRAVSDAPSVAAASAAPPDAATPAIATAHPLRVVVHPSTGSSVQFGDGAFIPLGGEESVEQPIDHDLRITVRNQCCVEQSRDVHVTDGTVELALSFRPAKIRAICDHAVDVTVDGRSATLGEITPVFFETMSERPIDVVFVGKTTDSHRVIAKASQYAEVKCAPAP